MESAVGIAGPRCGTYRAWFPALMIMEEPDILISRSSPGSQAFFRPEAR